MQRRAEATGEADGMPTWPPLMRSNGVACSHLGMLRGTSTCSAWRMSSMGILGGPQSRRVAMLESDPKDCRTTSTTPGILRAPDSNRTMAWRACLSWSAKAAESILGDKRACVNFQESRIHRIHCRRGSVTMRWLWWLGAHGAASSGSTRRRPGPILHRTSSE